jgi:hypothetical protein
MFAIDDYPFVSPGERCPVDNWKHRRGKDIKFVFRTWLLEGPPQIDWNVRLPLERARFRVHIENRVLVSVTENRPIA